MTLKMLVAAFNSESLTYVESGRQFGVDVRVLDCLESHHRTLATWFGSAVLQVRGNREDVSKAVALERFDVAVVHEDASDFVRSALITQSLREAGVPRIFVVTRNSERRSMYRRLGAHRVLVTTSIENAWNRISSYLPSVVTA